MIDILIKTPIGFLQSFFYVFFLFPDLIFSKGGYGAFPTSVVGWLLRTPIILHESDIVPGTTCRLIGKFAVEIFASFPVEKTRYFPKEKMISVGNPIRKEILENSPVRRTGEQNNFSHAAVRRAFFGRGGRQAALPPGLPLSHFFRLN